VLQLQRLARRSEGNRNRSNPRRIVATPESITKIKKPGARVRNRAFLKLWQYGDTDAPQLQNYQGK
jgi:hypothetical protein